MTADRHQRRGLTSRSGARRTSHRTDESPHDAMPSRAQKGSAVDPLTPTTTEGVGEAPSPARRRRLGERAAGLVEYALIMALIAAVCVVALGEFGDANGSSFDQSAQKIVTAGP
jgi:Flp pilus assembly pilin Flp